MAGPFVYGCGQGETDIATVPKGELSSGSMDVIREDSDVISLAFTIIEIDDLTGTELDSNGVILTPHGTGVVETDRGGNFGHGSFMAGFRNRTAYLLWCPYLGPHPLRGGLQMNYNKSGSRALTQDFHLVVSVEGRVIGFWLSPALANIAARRVIPGQT